MGERKSFPFPPRSSPLTLLSLWVPVVIWAWFIFYLSSIPHLRFFQNGLVDFIVRKLGHMGVFGILARLLTRAFSGCTYWSWKKIFAASLVLSILYACTDEYHQSFVPGRHASIVDVGIDSFGAWTALGWVP
jgi:hypothetical protein